MSFDNPFIQQQEEEKSVSYLTCNPLRLRSDAFNIMDTLSLELFELQNLWMLIKK